VADDLHHVSGQLLVELMGQLDEGRSRLGSERVLVELEQHVGVEDHRHRLPVPLDEAAVEGLDRPLHRDDRPLDRQGPPGCLRPTGRRRQDDEQPTAGHAHRPAAPAAHESPTGTPVSTPKAGNWTSTMVVLAGGAA
jgi:hypothetical protein